MEAAAANGVFMPEPLAAPWPKSDPYSWTCMPEGAGTLTGKTHPAVMAMPLG